MINIKQVDKYLQNKKSYQNQIVLIKSGVFYVTYNNDAKIINYISNYKVKELSDYLTLGFPVKIVEKIINKFKTLNLAYVIINNNDIYVSDKSNVTKNKYLNMLEESSSSYHTNCRIEKIHNNLKHLKNTQNINNILSKIESII